MPNRQNGRAFFRPSSLRCLWCGAVQTIQRPLARLRSGGHVKHLWCVPCQRRTPHREEVSD